MPFSVLGIGALILSSWFVDVGVVAQAQSSRIISCDGPFAPTTTPAKLAAAFGEANVTTESIHVGEGHYEEGTVLFSKSPENRLDILWTGGITHGRPRDLFVRGEKSRWRTAGGLALGASLQTVERLNRRPFRLLGFGWDYGGTVMHWSKGLLENAADGPCTIRARFAPVQNDRGEYVNGTEKYMSQVGGERQFSSGHPAMQALNPVVNEIFVQYER